jgi:serralysin
LARAKRNLALVDYTVNDDNVEVGGGQGETYNALDGNDTISLNSGALGEFELWHKNNIVNGGAGDDLLTTVNGAGGDTLNGDDGNDTLNASASNVTLNGGAGNDQLLGFGLNAVMAGGAGDDTYVFNQGQEPLSISEAVDAGNDTIRLQNTTTFSLAGYANIENLIGLAFNDIFTGRANMTLTGNALNNAITGDVGADSLIGGAGNDTLDGAAGQDSLTGGLGDDRFVIARTAIEFDSIVELAGEGTDTAVIYSGVEYTLPDYVENAEMAETDRGIASITGNALDNTFTGVGYQDTFAGKAGNDTYVVSGTEVITEAVGEGVDTVITSRRGFTLGDNVENLTGSAGGQALFGNALANTFMTAATAAGANSMKGLSGNDTYIVGEFSGNRDYVEELLDEGTDTVKTGLSDYVLGNNVENLVGTSSTLQTLGGNSLSNVITGGAGQDNISGGAGADVFDFNALAESVFDGKLRDSILDFERGIDDVDLRSIDANTKRAGNNVFKFIGPDGFHKVAGELNYHKFDKVGTAGDYTRITADVDGDGRSDFAVNLTGLVTLYATDFVL